MDSLPCYIFLMTSYKFSNFPLHLAMLSTEAVLQVPHLLIADPRRKLGTTIEHLIGPDMQPLLLGTVDAVWTLLLGILQLI